MATTPEGTRKKRLKKRFAELKVWFFMPGNNGFGLSGLPDFVLVVDGLFWGVETKPDGKKPTALQILRGQEIVKAGGKWSLVDSDEAEEQLVREIKAHLGC